MSSPNLRALLQAVQNGQMPIEAALGELDKQGPEENLGFAAVDHARAARQGFPEVIFGAGKTPEQTAGIAQSLAARGSTVLATRVSRAAFEATKKVLPGAIWHETARCLVVPGADSPRLEGRAGVLCAGTSDLPVADEAAVTLQTMGVEVFRANDIGVAGLHRLLGRLDDIKQCRALIVVAGMEGALPSVVAGLVSVPVVAVPTSVGYGAAFGGLAALLGMLNSCANGVAVVNIDNGFGAAAFVASMMRSS